MDQRPLFAALLGRWPAFFAWLIKQPDFDNDILQEHLSDNGIDDTLGFCPVHQGSSGEAWHFYPDADLNGGSVCNTCGSFSHGLTLLLKLYTAEQVKNWVDTWRQEQGIPEATYKVGQRIWQWHTGYHRNVALAYLRNRGLKLSDHDLPWAVRSSRSFEVYGPGGEKHGKRPAVLTLLRNANGHPTTYQMIVLGKDYQKANDIPSKHVKRTAGVEEKGALSHAYGELGAESGNVLVIAEGMETGMAVKLALTRLGLDPRVRVMLGGAGLTFLDAPIPDEVDTIILAADADAVKGITKRVAERGGSIFHKNRKVYLAAPDSKSNPKRDWLDVYVDEGIDAVQDGLSDAVLLTPASASELAEDAATRDQTIIDLDGVSDAELYERFDKAVLSQPPKHWYVHNGTVVEVNGTVMESPCIHKVAAEIDERFTFFADKFQRASITLIRKWWARRSLKNQLLKKLPEIEGVITRPTPVAVPDDKLGWLRVRTIERNGLDAKTNLLLHMNKREQSLWSDAGNTNRTIAWTMTQVLERDLFQDFCFDSPADKANAFAGLLTPMISEMVGMVPFVLADAPTPGSGKTTLIRALGAPWGGVHDVEYTHDDAEFSKKLASAFLSGNPLMLLDNLTGTVNSDNLKRLITAPKEMGLRVLGGNSMVYPPAGIVLYGTANNPRIQEEIQRRTLNIRLNSHMENPAMRSDFARKNLVEWASYHSPTLRRACYAILRAWLSDGGVLLTAPETFTGFERWSDTVYSLMMYAGLPEASAFLANRASRLEASDPEMEENRAFVQAWLEKYKLEPVASKDLRDLARRKSLLADVLAPNGDIAQDRKMKEWLRNMKDRVLCDHTVTENRQRTNKARVTYLLQPANNVS